MDRSDREWEKFGQQDPYYGVLSLQRFRKERLTEEARKEFFRSGEAHVAFVMDVIHRRVAPGFRATRVLDFGCGVGRCLIPWARLAGEAVGVDVSPSMVEEARRTCQEAGLSNVVLALADDALSTVSGSFDLVHAFLVFQHITPRRGERIFRCLIERLDDGGIGAVQVVYHRQVPFPVKLAGKLRRYVPLWHRLANLMAGKPWGEPLMEKNVYRLDRLFLALQDSGCGRICAVLFGRGAMRSALLVFQKTPESTPYDTLAED